MKLSPHGEWNIKKTVECGLDRANVLLQLRYQLAIAIFALIVGIWTILVTFSDGNDFKLIIPIGWALSIILILVWRLFTHIIVIEEFAWSITQLFCLNYLELLNLENDQFMTIENHFKLNEKTSYTSLKTIEEKLEVMRNLQSHLPENTILKFHLFSICLVIGSFEFLAIGNLLDWSQYPQIILVGYIIIVFGLILWTYPFDYFTDVAIDEAINKPKKRYSELKGI